MVDPQQPKATIMDDVAMRRAVTRIAHEILEHNEGAENLGLVGIVSRGVPLAEILSHEIAEIEGKRPPVGQLDISFYRDDIGRNIAPVLHATNIPFNVNRRDIVLVDDVLYTGRTVRAALDALMDIGRPRTVQLADGHWPPAHGSACCHDRPRPSRAAHTRRLRGQERSFLTVGGDSRAPQGHRYRQLGDHLG